MIVMILETYRCDQCEEESAPASDSPPQGWAEVTYFAEREEDDLLLHFCGLACAMKGCARLLDVREALEAAAGEGDASS